MESLMDMVEKVELALRRHIKCDATGLSPAVASVFLIGFEEAARAAIAAMREPTEEMVRAGVGALSVADYGLPEYGPEDAAEMTFSAMIDAALTSSEK
jgi:hypothetical protein